MDNCISGVLLNKVKIIDHPQGEILHAIKQSDMGFCGFGEAYFSLVHHGSIKAWKKHRQMTLNLIVPLGKIQFVIFDDRSQSSTNGVYQEVVLSLENYHRLTIPPEVWVGFCGIGKGPNMLLNIADLMHDPEEADRCEVDSIPYDWKFEK